MKNIEADIALRVEEIRDALPVDAEFDRRCLQAAQVAYSLAKMRGEITENDEVPIPVAQYVSALARSAEVEVEAVLTWAGVADRLVKPANIRAWVRLLEALRLGYDRAQFWMRVTLAEQNGHGPIPLAVARRGDGGIQNARRVCEMILPEIESTYTPDQQAAFQEIMHALSEAYER